MTVLLDGVIMRGYSIQEGDVFYVRESVFIQLNAT
jgi:hypothetical protein